MEQPALLEMRNITKEFPGVKALDGVSLTVRPGTVHALMGENGAGKSTLMKCLFGIYAKDEGTIVLDGKEVDFKNSKEALESGVAMVHQELNQALTRSVMDNLWLGRYPKVAGIMVSEGIMRGRTGEIFDELDVRVDPKAIMSTLPVSQRQMVEIAKAVSYNAKVIVFDEPTSSLTEAEVEHLFRIINMLREQGCGIIYISHKMDEILRISDEVTIMRDGKWVATRRAADLTIEEIIKLMVGRELTNRFPPKDNVPGLTVGEHHGPVGCVAARERNGIFACLGCADGELCCTVCERTFADVVLHVGVYVYLGARRLRGEELGCVARAVVIHRCLLVQHDACAVVAAATIDGEVEDVALCAVDAACRSIVDARLLRVGLGSLESVVVVHASLGAEHHLLYVYRSLHEERLARTQDDVVVNRRVSLIVIAFPEHDWRVELVLQLVHVEVARVWVAHEVPRAVVSELGCILLKRHDDVVRGEETVLRNAF